MCFHIWGLFFTLQNTTWIIICTAILITSVIVMKKIRVLSLKTTRQSNPGNHTANVVGQNPLLPTRAPSMFSSLHQMAICKVNSLLSTILCLLNKVSIWFSFTPGKLWFYSLSIGLNTTAVRKLEKVEGETCWENALCYRGDAPLS